MKRDYELSQKDKLIAKLKSKSRNFTFDDAEILLKHWRYVCLNKGKTSGSRVLFKSDKYAPIMLHKPHPRKELLEYQIKQLIEILEQEGLI